MREIRGKAKTVRELLKGVKYSIDYYQREYNWHDKQIRELMDDLSGKFLEEYDAFHPRHKVAEYPHYFLGSIIISKKDGKSYIVDGQQRLTSLTLLFLLLRQLQADRTDGVGVDELILSVVYGQKSFNMDIDERTACMEALYEGDSFDPTDRPESVRNLYDRYCELEQGFPEDLRGAALPYFVDWLLENVHLVEITAYSDDDAYTIFETMNDRGLSLSATEMLKGYLLANIYDTAKRAAANTGWRDRIRELNEAGKEVEPDCFKTWLRSQYATKIRERRKGARPEDFEQIGTEFHRWLRIARESAGLNDGDDFYRFIDRDFNFYSRQYLRLVDASRTPVKGLEKIFYSAQLGFTLQYLLLLAPLRPEDPDAVVNQKLQVVAWFVDILLAWRLWNSRSIAYSTMQYAAFIVMRDTRRLSLEALAQTLFDTLGKEEETFESNDVPRVNRQNRYSLHRVLARLTDYVETESGRPSRYVEYISDGKNRYEMEHIWADHPGRHGEEFGHATDFAEYRNRLGGLLLLPKSSNAAYGDCTYEDKLPHYLKENLLAQSLHPLCYERNAGFKRFVQESKLPFKSYDHFKRADLEERDALYRGLAERIWNREDLLREVGT